MFLMFLLLTADHLLLGIVYIAIDWWALDAFILAWFILMFVGTIFVLIRRQRAGKFERTLTIHRVEKPAKIDADAMYAYFVVCMKRGEKPGRRNWLGRSVPGHKGTISLGDWGRLVTHARYDGHLRYGGLGIGYINTYIPPPTSPEISTT